MTEACFEVESDGIFVTETITDDTIVLDRANQLYDDMKRRTNTDTTASSCSSRALPAIRMIIRGFDGYEIVINLR